MIKLFLLILLLSGAITVKKHASVSAKTTGYNLSVPDRFLILPESLKEISGIVPGTVFIYDIEKNKIKRKIIFHDKGDFEDLAVVNNKMYVLRSDGELFQLASMDFEYTKAKAIKSKVPAEDNEGLCYDPISDKLLIGCKSDIKKDKYKDERAIYSFDYKTQILSTKPFLVIDPKVIRKYVAENKINSGKNHNNNHIDFRISAIGIHPISKKIYVVCASDYLLCVFNRQGVPESIELLDHHLFNQTEGIAFLPNGDMILSNEGGNSKSTILRFNYNHIH